MEHPSTIGKTALFPSNRCDATLWSRQRGLIKEDLPEMATSLQERSKAAAERFRSLARRPVVVEFCGLPKAGKTTTLNAVQAFLKRCGFRVHVVVERASVCPIRDKKHSDFNVWTASTTLAQLLEQTQSPPHPDDPDILLLDRGLFDSICWLSMLEHLRRITPEDRERVEQFLLVDGWRRRVSGVVVMLSTSEDALLRERGLLPVDGVGGTIMNKEVLDQMRTKTEEVAQRLTNAFTFHILNTSDPIYRDNPAKTAEDVASFVMDLIENHLQEDILWLPKATISALFGADRVLTGELAARVASTFLQSGAFKPRQEVENDESLIQALPVAIIRNKSGDVLRLRRREGAEAAHLDEEIVIWAGGHVRQEDAENGDPLRQCLRRELQEELRLSIRPKELVLLGAIHVQGGRIGHHVAIVYDWRAATDDLAVAISRSEFYERRGTSLSGTFVSLDALIEDRSEDVV